MTGNYNDTSGTVNDKINQGRRRLLLDQRLHGHLRRQRAHRDRHVQGPGRRRPGRARPQRHHPHQRRHLQRRPLDLHRRTGNYNDTSGTVNDKIDKADADCSSISGYTVTFDGNAHTATGTCKGVDGNALAGLDKSGTTHTNAGTYNADPWTFTDVTGNYNDTSGTVNDKINQASADCSSISGYTVTFDGNAHTATGSCKDLGGNDLPGLDLSGTTHTNAGTYNTDPWSFAGTTNYAPKNGTVNDKINKAGADCSSISGYTVTFDGNAHTATGSCKGVDGNALAGLDKSGTTHTNAGTYNADPWTFTDVTGNYNDTSGTVNDKINQASADCSSISGYTVTFDGNAHTATGSCKDLGGNDLPGLDISGTTHTNAGTYNADPWSFAGTTNYAPKNGTVNDKINKAGADCSSISGYTVTFDGNAHTASGSCKGVDGNALAGLDKSGTTHTNAGTYNADPWTFTDVTGNYNDTSGTVNDKINQASADCSSISGYTVTFDGNAHTATGSCKDLGGGDLLGLDKSGTTHTNAGTYNADPWSFAGTTNYAPKNGTVNDKINKAGADCSSISGYTVTFDGNAHTASGSCKGVDGNALAGLDKSGTTHTNAGTYNADPWTFTDVTGNYNDTSGTVNDKINQASADCSSISGYTVTFDGNAHTATGSCKDLGGDDLLGLDHSGTTHTNAGTYNADPWSFAGTTNYAPKNGAVNDKINKARRRSGQPVTTSPTTGTPTPPPATAKGVGGADLSNLLGLGGTTHTNAGTYNADPWTFAGNDNYEADSGTVNGQPSASVP